MQYMYISTADVIDTYAYVYMYIDRVYMYIMLVYVVYCGQHPPYSRDIPCDSKKFHKSSSQSFGYSQSMSLNKWFIFGFFNCGSQGSEIW